MNIKNTRNQYQDKLILFKKTDAKSTHTNVTKINRLSPFMRVLLLLCAVVERFIS